MKGNNVITSILLFICFGLYVALELKLPCKNGDKQCGENTKRLQAENDSLEQSNRLLDERYRNFQVKADSLNEKLSSTKQTVIQLKNKQHEKINSIDALNNDELFSFFSKFNTESNSTK